MERDQVVCLLGTVSSTRAGNQGRLRGQFASREKHVSDKVPMKESPVISPGEPLCNLEK